MQHTYPTPAQKLNKDKPAKKTGFLHPSSISILGYSCSRLFGCCFNVGIEYNRGINKVNRNKKGFQTGNPFLARQVYDAHSLVGIHHRPSLKAVLLRLLTVRWTILFIFGTKMSYCYDRLFLDASQRDIVNTSLCP